MSMVLGVNLGVRELKQIPSLNRVSRHEPLSMHQKLEWKHAHARVQEVKLLDNRCSLTETKSDSTIRLRHLQEPYEGHWCKRISLTLVVPIGKKFHFLVF